MIKQNEELVLVAASGGLDSSVTACILQLAGYKNIVLTHFNYGHRGGKAEEIAITNIATELDVKLKIFDIKSLYNEMGVEGISMLANESAPITTGTTAGLKLMHA